jgi:hypothetical protein
VAGVGGDPAWDPDCECGNSGAAETTECCAPRETSHEGGHR